MATYYVSRVNGQLKYRLNDWPDAANGTVPSPCDLNQIFYVAGNGSEVVLDSITYSGLDLDELDGVDIGRTEMTIRGPISTDPDFANRYGVPIIDGTGKNDHTLQINGDNTILGKIKLMGSDSSFYNLSVQSYTVANDTILDGGDRGYLIAGSAVFNRVIVKNHKSYAGDINGTYASLVNNLPVVINNGNSIRVLRGNYTENKALSINNRTSISVSGDNAQQVTLNNSTHLGSMGESTLPTLVNTSTNAVCVANNCLIGGCAFGPTLYSSGFTLNTCVGSSPRFMHPRRNGYLPIVIDDTSNRSTFAILSDIAKSHGYCITWAVNTTAMTAEDWENARKYVADGHEIASHSCSHAHVTATESIKIQYIGDGESCALTISNGNISTIVTGKVGEDLNIDLSSHTFFTLSSLIDSNLKYTCSPNLSTDQDVPARFISDCTSHDIKMNEFTCGIKVAEFIEFEIAESKLEIEANIPGYTCLSFINPYFATSAEVKQAISEAGYIGARINAEGSKNLLDIEAFAVYGSQVGALFGMQDTNPTEEQIKRTVAALSDRVTHVGECVVILGHFLENTLSDYAQDRWEYVFDALAQAGAPVLPFGAAMEGIMARAESTSGTEGTLHYLSSEESLGDVADYHLQPDSPCRNAGTAIEGITTDLDGNQYPSPNGASIGPHEDYPLLAEGRGPWSHFDGSVNPLDLSDTSPANLLEVKVETNE